MSKKIAFTSIMCIALGSTSIISGPLVNTGIGYLIEDMVDEILVQVSDLSQPHVEDIVECTNFAVVVGLIIEDSPLLKRVLKEDPTLGGLVDIAIPLMNALDPLSLYFDVQEKSFLGIKYRFSSLISIVGPSFSIEHEIKGISEWAGEDLNFGSAKDALIYGINDLPGICQIWNNHLRGYSGEMWWKSLQIYEEVKGDPEKEQELAEGYGTTWYKLNKIFEYYYNYFLPEIIPKNIEGGVVGRFLPEVANMNKAEIAYHYFLVQWANCSILPQGFDVYDYDMIPGAPPGILGFEVGYPIASGISCENTYALWNINNPYAIINSDGNKLWWDALTNKETRNILQEAYGFSNFEMDRLIKWRVRFTSYMIPILGGPFLGLGVDITTLRNGIEMGMLSIGSVLTAIGSIGIIGVIGIARRNKNRNLKLPPKLATQNYKKKSSYTPTKKKKVNKLDIKIEDLVIQEDNIIDCNQS